jgi:hypothetical protein
MIDVSATATVQCSAQDVIDFVLDVERYRHVDHKIGRVLKTETLDGDHIVIFNTSMRGLPARARQRMHVIGTERIEVSPMPSWQDNLMTFRGLFELTPVADGVQVRHAYHFDFKPPMRWIVEPYIRGWLAQGIEDEVQDLKLALEQQAHA